MMEIKTITNGTKATDKEEKKYSDEEKEYIKTCAKREKERKEREAERQDRALAEFALDDLIKFLEN